MLDPWRTLGLEPGATAADVKRAYRRLAKAFHPDAAGGQTLPRFLAIQQAYEALMAPRSPRTALGRAAGTGAGPAPRPAWQADPARAKASGGPRRGSRQGNPGPTGGSRATGAEPGSRSGGSGDGAERPRRHRRAPKRATFGSTTYGDAHEPAPEEGWTGASWYGTTSGEYWTINPREYADPRKHGPEYQARARREAPSEDGQRARRAPERDPSPGPTPPPPPPADRPAYRSEAGAADAAPSAWAVGSPSEFPSLPSLSLPDGHARWGRLVLVLLAWLPIGIVVATFTGEATGCARYTAACAAGADLLPWAAQAVILTLLALGAAVRPGATRALAMGTVGVIAIAIPATILLAAAGATYDPVRGPVALSVLLGLGWFSGLGFASRGRLIAVVRAGRRATGADGAVSSSP